MKFSPVKYTMKNKNVLDNCEFKNPLQKLNLNNYVMKYYPS